MKINELIEKIDFCSKNEREFVFDDEIKLPYYCCKKTISKDCSNICNTCKSIYARYVVIDLTDENVKQICDDVIFKNKETFSYFQENYLSEIFFYESDFIRFNIYLIFIYDKKEDVKEYIDYSFDLNYARKLFFTPVEFEEYFDYYNKIRKRVTETKYSMDQEILKELEAIVSKLDSKGMKAVLLDSDNIINYFVVHPLNYQNNYDIQCGIKESTKSFVEKYIYKDKGKGNRNLKNVRDVRNLKLKNFRNNCFGDSRDFQFGRANIIYGVNAAGKTSLLDAIEFGFTGNIHKYKEEDVLGDALVTIVGRTGTTVSSDESQKYYNEFKSMWYPYKIGSLSELFARTNYFDTDATYRFALEQGNIDEAYRHIRNLLSTSKLLEIEQNLKNNIEEIKRVKVFINRDNYYFKKVVSTKNSKSNQNKSKRFSLFSFVKDLNESKFIYSVNEKRLKAINSELKIFEDECYETLKRIRELIDKQIKVNLKLLNIIFHRLFSLNYDIIWENGIFKMQSDGADELTTIEKMSTAQKVSLALSVIFTQFFLAADAPQIILLDESVVNFDAFHLLNLFDFLREFTINDVQIFFTTASEDIAQIAKSKLGFLGEECFIYEMTRTAGGESLINKVN